MKIVADENIPLVRELFAPFGELQLLPGRAIGAADVRTADALLIRSVTHVNASLLADSQLRFVGSATIGTDHIDTAALASQGIGFANAPGCNANAVAEYVLAALLVLAERGKFRPGQDVIGILGYGNVGSRLAAKLDALRWPYRVCDPPLAQQLAVDGTVSQSPREPMAQRRDVMNGSPKLLPQAWVSPEALLDCDVLTLHVPLNKIGPDATWHWLNADAVNATRARVIINSCRGPVVDNRALLRWLQADTKRAAVLDVWEHEPDVPVDLLARIDLATPHIAGHSREGKCNGSFMIHAAFCQQFGFDASAAQQWQLPEAGQGELLDVSAQTQLLTQLLACYDPRRDDAAMRAALMTATEGKAAFDLLRKQYPERRELLSWRFSASASVASRFQALAGFD